MITLIYAALFVILGIYIFITNSLPQILWNRKITKLSVSIDKDDMYARFAIDKTPKIRFWNALYFSLLPIPLVIGAFFLALELGIAEKSFFFTEPNGDSIRNNNPQLLCGLFLFLPLTAATIFEAIALRKLSSSGETGKSVMLAFLFLSPITLTLLTGFILFGLATSG